jgi:hypothetical protein
MITVNPVFINEVMGPLIGGADSEEDIEAFSRYNPDVEEEVKELAKAVLLPEFIQQKDILRQKVKDSLAYYLNFPEKADFESILDSLLIPMKTPKNASLFFQWIWDIFFNQESIEYIKNETVKEDFDVNAATNLKIQD